MKAIDLTHYIEPSMPVYPGTEPPVIKQATSIAADGFAEKWLAMYSHTGTHIDAPGHILAGRPTLDAFSVDTFLGQGLVVDLASAGLRSIERADLEPWAGRIVAKEFVLFHTGWAARWGSADYFEDFPVLSPAAAQWLGSCGLKGIGLDCLSVDPVDVTDMAIHRILLGQELVIIENLCNLEQLVDRQFLFAALPLKLHDADGSPVRAVGILK